MQQEQKDAVLRDQLYRESLVHCMEASPVNKGRMAYYRRQEIGGGSSGRERAELWDRVRGGRFVPDSEEQGSMKLRRGNQPGDTHRME